MNDKKRAHGAVRAAVVSGALPPTASVCCTRCAQPAAVYHHHHGYKPAQYLDVVALCARCHLEAHGNVLTQWSLLPRQVKVTLNGERLRHAREDQALSQRDLAERSGVALATISRLETGKQNAYPTTVRKLAKALGVAPRAIYGESETG